MLSPIRLNNIHFTKNSRQSKTLATQKTQAFNFNNDAQSLMPMISSYTRLDSSSYSDKDFSKIIGYMAKSVEDSINTGLEDTILAQHETIKAIVERYRGKNNIDLTNKKTGIRYLCMHDFHTIQIMQEYKGRALNADFYYYGKPDGKLTKEEYENQTAFAYPNTKNPSCARYEFRDFNLDDTHGLTDVTVNDDKLVTVETGRDMLAPIKTRYYYDRDGKLSHAVIINYSLKDRTVKNTLFVFNENREVEKVYYGYKTTLKTGDKIERFADAEFVRNQENGEFELGRTNFNI